MKTEMAWMDSPEGQQFIAGTPEGQQFIAGQEFLRQRSDPWGIKETEPAAGYKEGGVVGEKGPENVLVGEGGEKEVIIPMSKLAKALGTEGAQLMASSVEGDPNQQMSAIRTYLNKAAVEEELASKSTVPGEKQSARYRSERAEQEGRPDIAADTLAQMRADPSYKKGYAEAWEHYSNNPSEVSLDTRFPAKARRALHPTEAKGALKDEPYLLAYSEVLEEMRRRAEEEDERRMEASSRNRAAVEEELGVTSESRAALKRYEQEREEQSSRPDIRADELAQIRSDPAFMESYKATMEEYEDEEDLPMPGRPINEFGTRRVYRGDPHYGEPRYSLKERAEFLRDKKTPVTGKKSRSNVYAGQTSGVFGEEVATAQQLGYWEALEELERRRGSK